METLPPAHHKQRYLDDNIGDIKEIKLENGEKSITIGDFHQIDEIDDEVWLLQCPKDTDLSELVGHKLKLPGRSQAGGLETVAMENASETEQQHTFGYCTRKGKYALRRLPMRGIILVRQPLKAQQSVTEERLAEISPLTERVLMPDFIKVRHPLLGANFEKKLYVPANTASRLKEADNNCTEVTSEARIAAMAMNRKHLSDDAADLEIDAGSKKKGRKRTAAGKDVTDSKKKKQRISSETERKDEDLKWLTKLV